MINLFKLKLSRSCKLNWSFLLWISQSTLKYIRHPENREVFEIYANSYALIKTYTNAICFIPLPTQLTHDNKLNANLYQIFQFQSQSIINLKFCICLSNTEESIVLSQ